MGHGTNILVRPDGRLRAGWRLALFCLLFVFATAVVSGLASPFFAATSLILNAVILGGATFAATWVMMRFVEGRPLRDVGLGVARNFWPETGWGIVGGIALAGSVTGIEWAGGLIFFQAAGTNTSESLGSFVSLTGILLVSAATEELLFRGYPFQRLVEGLGGPSAIGIVSLTFGVVHAFNPHSTAVGVLNAALAGVLLSLAYLKTRALWLPIGIHFGWNWSLTVFDLPVSGLELMDMPWRAIPVGLHQWLHGGDYGPEGGLIATFVLLAGTVYLARGLKSVESPGASPIPPATVE